MEEGERQARGTIKEGAALPPLRVKMIRGEGKRTNGIKEMWPPKSPDKNWRIP